MLYLPMENVTQYLKDLGRYNTKIIHRFLRQERVKYFIGNDKTKVLTKPGRYESYTLFSDDLFELFELWLNKIPINLLNRKEYEVKEFIESLFQDSIYQYKIGDYIYDWYIPSKDLLIEFNEKEHKIKNKILYDEKKYEYNRNHLLFIIHEKTCMRDLAELAKVYL